jgi:uracil-DNA glycosylase
VAFRLSNRGTEPDWFNGAVPSFGRDNAADVRLLIVGLAPGLKGANRTGRPFTGDYAGELLYETLLAYGFAQGRYRARPDDGLTLLECASDVKPCRFVDEHLRRVGPRNRPRE